jgi:NADPH-dependent curcumin reductase CurA
MATIRALHLAARPEGVPKDTDFELRETNAPELGDGELRVAVRYISIDPSKLAYNDEVTGSSPVTPTSQPSRSQPVRRWLR